MAVKWLSGTIMQRELAAAQVAELDDGDSDILTQAMEDGEAIVLSYIGTRYATQCAAGTASNEVRRLACDCALHELGKRKVGFQNVFRTRFEDVSAALEKIRRGWRDIYEWEVAAGTRDPLALGALELPQMPPDLYAEDEAGDIDYIGVDDDVEPGASL